MIPWRRRGIYAVWLCAIVVIFFLWKRRKGSEDMRTVDRSKTYSTVPAGTTATPVAGSTPQSAARSAAFAQPLAVLLKDADGNPMQNVVITYVVPGSGASATLSATTAVTNLNGIASVTATANATAGGYAVTGGVSGAVVPAAFSLTNT